MMSKHSKCVVIVDPYLLIMVHYFCFFLIQNCIIKFYRINFRKYHITGRYLVGGIYTQHKHGAALATIDKNKNSSELCEHSHTLTA